MDDEPAVSDSQLQAEVNARREEVSRYLPRDRIRALILSLQNPPISTKSAAIKEENAAIVEAVIEKLQDSELAAAVEALDFESCDVLMKYLYRLMGKASNCGTALKLHALLHEKGGPGCIVRALTDRKQI